jgi:16S rRNA (guanine527-N7)-methyltransferase
MTREVVTTPKWIAKLLAPFLGATLTDSQLTAVGSYINLLLKWNSKLNLTAIRDPEGIVTRHFGESLFASRQLFPVGNSHESVIDVGSGAGFPGLPLKLWSQNIDLTLIESNQRKATFLREVIRTLDLRSAIVLSQRAESVSVRADVVTFRAVERFERILPVALGLLKPRGRIAILIGEAQVDLAQSILPDVEWKHSMPIPSSKNRRLLIGGWKTSFLAQAGIFPLC